jgi:hypothetical protein
MSQYTRFYDQLVRAGRINDLQGGRLDYAYLVGVARYLRAGRETDDEAIVDIVVSKDDYARMIGFLVAGVLGQTGGELADPSHVIRGYGKRFIYPGNIEYVKIRASLAEDFSFAVIRMTDVYHVLPEGTALLFDWSDLYIGRGIGTPNRHLIIENFTL